MVTLAAPKANIGRWGVSDGTLSCAENKDQGPPGVWGDQPVVDLPQGLPDQIDSPLAWTAEDFQSSEQLYTIPLSDVHIKELEAASRRFQDLGLPLDDIDRSSFLLPTLGPTLRSLAWELAAGKGFFVLKGLDPERYAPRENVIIYLGISAYISQQRGRQDEYGNMLLHLIDLGCTAAPNDVRQAPYSNVGQPFHTDVGDIVGLFALGEPAQGGESQLASAWSVYNEIRKTRPDVIRLLAEPSWIFDRFGQDPPFERRPIVYLNDDRTIRSFFSRRPLVGSHASPRSNGIPSLSPAQKEALDVVQLSAERQALTLALRKGDMLFWHNGVHLHCRKGFMDDAHSKRHLLRLWLRSEIQSAPVPVELQPLWDDAFAHRGRKQLWPVVPIMDREYICNQQRSSGYG